MSCHLDLHMHIAASKITSEQQVTAPQTLTNLNFETEPRNSRCKHQGIFLCGVQCTASLFALHPLLFPCFVRQYDLCTIKDSPLIQELIHSAAHFDLVSQIKYSTHNTQVFFSSFV
mmetsp:Transcript_6167/g.17578  ORF Transcript_6167/g.17578 Transcript_6167/m.17578 type:complete len:116 (+) Transcript_6167:667-1014(+)